ncbi:BrnA antitoxin family protein [Pseudomonas sp. Marseille-P9899]|uniref:BrnA antitoxin family protein n=1 Tax=Pseudomonas sp. Marseille-P9899 TaxID=2730401 RepID=UPI00158C14D4|nr:BrnA antitoxin family protein [Pseudomonas sp. Marseille-P9899]
MSKTSKTDWDRLARMDDKDIDTSDIPELGEAFFRNAQLRLPTKQAMTIRLDSDVLEWFKLQGPGYQTRINQLLRQYMQAQEQLQEKAVTK